MKRAQTGYRAFSTTPAAVAAGLAVCLALPANAQFFASSGATFTTPTNLLPVAPGTSVFDYTGNRLIVGGSAPGSFSAMTGALLKGNSIVLGTGGTGNGTATLTGPGTRAELTGTTGRLDVASWGVGALTVSAGAVLDATLNTGGCSAASCNSFVGNGAGSAGTLTVTGSGSEVRLVRNFNIGQTSVFTVPVASFNFGTPGGTTNAFVSVLDGAKLRSQFAIVGAGPNLPSAIGTERGFGTVVVDGAGSQWTVTRNSVDNTAAGMQIGERVNGQGDVTIRNGGKLLVDGSGGVGPNDFINLGRSGGRGTLTVTGVGSNLEMVGTNTVLQPGRGGAGAQGSFNLLAGATASMLYMNVGRDQAIGTVVIDGAGTLLSQVGVGTANVDNNGGSAFGTIGRDGGTGQATVSNGARWFVSNGTGDNRASVGSPGIAIGRGVGSTGSLAITGPGSTVEIVANSLGLAPGVADNYNAFMAVGFDNGSTGQLTVSAGGKLLLTGNSVSTLTDGRTTGLHIGGRANNLPGQGAATVTGVGSEIVVSGSDSLINVGRGPGGVGSLNVLDKARVASTSLVVGAFGNGTVNVDDATIALSGVRTNPAVGAGTTVGRGTGGVGTMNLGNGARLTLENNILQGGMGIGGDSFASGGSGNVALTGGSSILFSGSVASNLTVGRTGNGVLSVAGGSTVDVAGGSVLIGREAGGAGAVALSGGSNLNAAYVGVGSSNTGTGVLTVGNSVVTAGTVEIDTLGILSGDGGTINGNVILRGVMNLGAPPSQMTINGSFLSAGGQLLLDVESNGSGFDLDQLLLTKGSTFDFTGLQVTFNFLAGTDPNAFLASGGFDLDNFLLSLDTATSLSSALSTQFAPGETWTSVFAGSTFDARTDTSAIGALRLGVDGSLTFSAAPIPEPETWALMVAGLALVSGISRRRARRAGGSVILA